MVAAAGLFRHPTTLTMNKTMIQYRNKTISHYHDHAHDHVHLHGPGDWASLLIAVIVMVGVLIAVIAVACMVSNKKTIIRGAEKYGGAEVSDQHDLSSPYILVFHFRCGRGSAATCDELLGSDSRTVSLRWRGSDKCRGGGCLEVRGYDSHITSADINHGLGYKNNFGLPVTSILTRTIIIFLTRMDCYKNCANRFTHTELSFNYLSLQLHNTCIDLSLNV